MNDVLICQQLKTQLTTLKNSLFSGCLSVEVENGHNWNFYFRLGRICWQSGGINPLEKWQKGLKYLCNDLDLKQLTQLFEIKEAKQQHQILLHLQSKHLVPRVKICNYLNNIIAESLFDIIINNINNQNNIVTFRTISDETFGTIIHLVEPIVALEKSLKAFQQWSNTKSAKPSDRFFFVWRTDRS